MEIIVLCLALLIMYAWGYVVGYKDCEDTTKRILNKLIEDYKIETE